MFEMSAEGISNANAQTEHSMRDCLDIGFVSIVCFLLVLVQMGVPQSIYQTFVVGSLANDRPILAANNDAFTGSTGSCPVLTLPMAKHWFTITPLPLLP